MSEPLVSVVCLCYNHERFVNEAIQSVLGQTYANIQLLVVDDHSTDQSVEVISKTISQHPSIEFIPLSSNLGNCRAFNKGFEKVRGDFVIDLAGDDVLIPERVEKGTEVLLSKGLEYGVHFSDAALIDETGGILGFHSDRFPHETIPQGDVYAQVLSRYFINSPTMMMRRQVFEKLGGYDESLAYEDFDFWVRSSRYFKYWYTPRPLVKRRVLSSSLGRRQYRKGSLQLKSTLRVCEKALSLNQNAAENAALKKRVRYEARQAFLTGAFNTALGYLNLWRKIS